MFNIKLPVEMLKLLHLVIFFTILFSCKEDSFRKDTYNVRSDIRLGSKFYSFYISKDGKAFVIKGTGSYYTEPLKVETSDTSEVFKLDSVNVFYNHLNRIKENPIIGVNRSDVPRVEIYYNKEKIYDAYKWDETFWDLFKPIMEQIPKGYNPFQVDDQPF